MRPIFREQGSVESLAPGLKRMAYESLMVFTGNANPLLAHAVVRRLDIPLGHATVGKFSDGEILVELLENVRGKDCFVLQSTCAPANDSLMEVLLMVDALKRASAARVTAAIPYFGYARQDRRPRSARVAISAKVAANMLQAAGVDRVLTMDLHADQITGFFDVLVDNISASPVLLGDVWKHQYENLLVVSPDVGGVVRARGMAKRLESDLAIIDKRRPQPNVSEVMNVIGDVKGRNCVIMDDMVDTANTLVKAAQALKDEGAARVVAYCTHPVLSGGAVERIAESRLDELGVTDSIPLSKAAQGCKKIRVLSVAGLLAETILRISNEDSVSSLFIECFFRRRPVAGGASTRRGRHGNRSRRANAHRAREGCEPPPAPQREGPRGSLRGQEARGQHRARAQPAVPPDAQREVSRVGPDARPGRREGIGAAAGGQHASVQDAGGARRLPEGFGGREDPHQGAAAFRQRGEIARDQGAGLPHHPRAERNRRPLPARGPA